MSAESPIQDPLEFMKSMWNSMGFSIPGMVTPTLDVGELDKRIADLKTVENWLKMNLNMLQMSIQGLEMQRVTLQAMQAISQTAGSPEAANAFANTALWPWNFLHPSQPSGGADQAPAEPKAAGKSA